MPRLPRFRLIVCALTLVLGASIVACKGGDDTPEETPTPTPISDATAAVLQAAEATRTADSYQLEIAFSPLGSPVVSLVLYDKGDYYERIPGDLIAGGNEYIYSGHFLYKRECTRPNACAAWTRDSQRPLIPSLAGTVNSVPETLAPVAAELATGWTLVPGAEPKMKGTVVLKTVIEENMRRAFTASGNSPEDVESAVAEFGASLPVEPSEIDITLTADYKYISRLNIYIPGQAPDPYFQVAYSNFGNVVVDPPEGF